MPFQRNDPKRLSESELIDQVRNRYAEGATLRELAEEFRRDEEFIRRLMIKAGIPRRPRGQPVGKHLPSGGRTTDPDGYVLCKANDHPHANSGGYVREHRLVMEAVLGRFLLSEEVVHHINGQKADNRLANLQLYASNAEHKKDDMVGNSWAKGDIRNPKRSRRTIRTPYQIMQCLKELDASLDHPIQRTDLQPPMPSYRAVARAFGSWQEAVLLALGEKAKPPKQ